MKNLQLISKWIAISICFFCGIFSSVSAQVSDSTATFIAYWVDGEKFEYYTFDTINGPNSKGTHVGNAIRGKWVMEVTEPNDSQYLLKSTYTYLEGKMENASAGAALKYLILKSISGIPAYILCDEMGTYVETKIPEESYTQYKNTLALVIQNEKDPLVKSMLDSLSKSISQIQAMENFVNTLYMDMYGLMGIQAYINRPIEFPSNMGNPFDASRPFQATSRLFITGNENFQEEVNLKMKSIATYEENKELIEELQTTLFGKINNDASGFVLTEQLEFQMDLSKGVALNMKKIRISQFTKESGTKFMTAFSLMD